MAGTKRHGTLGPAMSRGELIGGFLYLPFYIILLGLLIDWVPSLWGKTLSATTANAVYFLVNFIAVALIFRRFLIASLSAAARRFWPFVQAAVLGFVFYYALAWVLSLVLTLLKLTVANPNDAFVADLAGGNRPLMAVCILFLGPLVEETLFRGLIFGNLHLKSRWLAYILTTLAFAAIHVWQYVGLVGWTATVLSAIQYIPAGIALGWTYEKAESVWAPLLVHSLINAMSLGILWG